MFTDGDVSASVLIPSHNGAATIGAALAALRGQVDAPTFEVLVVDDRSTDGTAQVVARHSDGLDVRVIPAVGQGVSSARNQLASEARADLLLYTDDDDEVGPRWVFAHVELLKKHEMSTGPVDHWSPTAPWMLELRPTPAGGGPATAADHLPFAYGTNTGIRRSVLRSIGGWRGPIGCEDVHLSWCVQNAGGTLGYDTDARVRYLLRADNRSLFRQYGNYASAHQWLYREHGLPIPLRRLRLYGWLLGHLGWAISRNPRRRGRFVLEAATAWGRWRGAVHHRSRPW